MYKISNEINDETKMDGKEIYLFAKAKRVVKFPDGNTLAVGFETQDEYGRDHGEMYILCSGCFEENHLMMGFLEHTYWYQNLDHNKVSSREFLKGIKGDTAGIRVRYTGCSPEIIETFCVCELDEHGFELNGLELAPKSAGQQ